MADGALENLLKVYNRKDGDFFHTTLGVQMHLYYKLWLYYHLAGKNNKFYPRLFELLRQDPMNITVDQDGAQSLLHSVETAPRGRLYLFRLHHDTRTGRRSHSRSEIMELST